MVAEYTEHESQHPAKASTAVIIGIGNDYRRDDAAGLLVARALRKLVPGEVHVYECTGSGLELIDLWSDADLVLLIDAVSSGADPGTIYCIEVHKQPIPSYLFHYSTHDFSVADTIELSRMLGKLPPHLVVFGIEGLNFAQGQGLTDEVAASIETLPRKVLDYLNHSLEGD